MRLKFSVTELLGLIAQRRERLEKQHDRAMRKYEAKRDKAMPVIVARLHAAADELAADPALIDSEAFDVSMAYGEESPTIRVKVPGAKIDTKPFLDTRSFNYAEKALERTKDDKVSLTPEEVAWYTEDD